MVYTRLMGIAKRQKRPTSLMDATGKDVRCAMTSLLLTDSINTTLCEKTFALSKSFFADCYSFM